MNLTWWKISEDTFSRDVCHLILQHHKLEYCNGPRFLDIQDLIRVTLVAILSDLLDAIFLCPIFSDFYSSLPKKFEFEQYHFTSQY